MKNTRSYKDRNEPPVISEQLGKYGWRVNQNMAHIGMYSEIYKHRQIPNHRFVVDEDATWNHYAFDARSVGGSHKRYWGEVLSSGGLQDLAKYLKRFHGKRATTPLK